MAEFDRPEPISAGPVGMSFGQQLEIERRANELTERYPLIGSDPMLVMGLAQDLRYDTDQMNRIAMEIEGEQGISTRIAALSEESESRQRAMFNAMTPDMQAALTEAGYEVPRDKGWGPRINLPNIGPIDLPELGLSNAGNIVGRVLSAPTIIPAALGDAAGVGLRAISQVTLERPMSLMMAATEDIGLPTPFALSGPLAAIGQTAGMYGEILRTGDLTAGRQRASDIWQDAWDPNRSWTDRAKDEARGAARTEENYQLARELAAGRKISDVLMDRGLDITDPQWQDQYLELYAMSKSPEVTAAARELAAGRRHFGGWLIRDIPASIPGLGEAQIQSIDDFYLSKPGLIAAAGADLAIEWYADPFIVMGSMNKLTRANSVLRVRSGQGSLDLSRARLASTFHQIRSEGVDTLSGSQLEFLDFLGIAASEDGIARALGANNQLARFNLHNQGASLNRVADLVVNHFNPATADDYVDLLELHNAHISAAGWWKNAVDWNEMDKTRGALQRLNIPEGSRWARHQRVNQGFATRDDWFRYLSDKEYGMQMITGSTLGGISPNAAYLPHMSRAHQLSYRARSAWFNKALDWQADLTSEHRRALVAHAIETKQLNPTSSGGVAAITQDQLRTIDGFNEQLIAQADEWISEGNFDELGRFIVGHPEDVVVATGVARAMKDRLSSFMLGFTTKVPKHGLIFMDDTAEQTQSVIETIGMANLTRMPREMRNVYMERLLLGTQAEQVATVQTFLGQMMLELGIIDNATGEGMDLWNRYVRHSEMNWGRESLQNFSGRDVTMGVMRQETARVLSLPDFRELAKLASQQHKLTAFGSRPYQLANRAMSRVWKPVQLMRPGFILRAGGEELVTFLLSVGPGDYAAAKWALPRHVDDWSDGSYAIMRSRGWNRDLAQNGYDWYRHRGLKNLEETRELIAAKPLHWFNYSLRRMFNVTEGDMYHRAMRRLEADDVDAFMNLRGGLIDDDAISAWKRVDSYVQSELDELHGLKGFLVEYDQMVTNFSNAVANHFMTIGNTLDKPLDVRLANKIARRQARSHALNKSDEAVESMLGHYRQASMMIHSQAGGMRAFSQAAGNLYDPTKGMKVGAESFDEDPIHSMRQLGVRQYGNEWVAMDLSTDPEGYRWGLEAIFRRDASDDTVKAALAEMDGWIDQPTAERLHRLFADRRPGVRWGDTPIETMVNMRRTIADESKEVIAAWRAFAADPTATEYIDFIVKNSRSERTKQLAEMFRDFENSDVLSMDMLTAITANTPTMYVLGEGSEMPELVDRLARIIEREAWRPGNVDSRRWMSILNRDKGGALVAAVPSNVAQYLYMPTIPVEAQKRLAELMADPVFRSKFAQALERSLAGRQPGQVLAADIDRAVEGVLSGADISTTIDVLSPEVIEVLDYFHPSTWTMDDLTHRSIDNIETPRDVPDAVPPQRGSFTDVHQMAAGRVSAMRTDGLTAPAGAVAFTNPVTAQQVTWALREVLEESGWMASRYWPDATFSRIAVPDADLARGMKAADGTEMIRVRNPDAGVYQVNPTMHANAVPMSESRARPLYHAHNTRTGEERMMTMSELGRESEVDDAWEMLGDPNTPVWTTEATEAEVVREASQVIARELINRYTTLDAKINEFRPLREVITPMLDNTLETATVDRLMDNAQALPRTVWGPKLVSADDLLWDKIVQSWFDGPVSSSIDSMIREPMFVDTFAKALRDNEWFQQYRVQQTQLLLDRMMADGVFAERPEMRDQVVGMIDDFADNGHLDRLVTGNLGPKEANQVSLGDSIQWRVNKAIHDGDYQAFQRAVLDLQTFGLTRQYDAEYFTNLWVKARKAMDDGEDIARVWTLDEVLAFLPKKFHGTRATVVDETADLPMLRENIMWDEDLAAIPDEVGALPSETRVVDDRWEGWGPEVEDIGRRVGDQNITGLEVVDVDPIGPQTELFSFRDTDLKILAVRSDDSSEIVGAAMWFGHDSTKWGQFAFVGNYNIADTKLVAGMRQVLGADHPITRQLRGVVGIDVLPNTPFRIRRARHGDDFAGVSWRGPKDQVAEYFTPERISDSIQARRTLNKEVRDHNKLAAQTGMSQIKHPLGLTREHFDKLRTYQRARARANEMYFQTTLERTLGVFNQYIDDHRIRSQFQQYINPLIPFWFAEEQFLMRMGRRIYDSPEMIRRAQLLMNFGRSSTIIQEDEFGNEVVVIPGSQLATQAIGAVAEYVSGSVARVPVVGDAVEGVTSWVPFLPPLNDATLGLSNLGDMSRPLTFQTDFALPGYNLEQTGQFQYGPLVQLAANQLSYRYPELARGADRWLGDERATAYQNPIDMLLPAFPRRLLTAVQGNMSDQDFARAMSDAILQLEAAGLGPDENATSTQIEKYLDNLRNVTRINSIFLTMFSASAPASVRPESLFGDLRQEFLDLLQDSGLDYQEAIAAFLEQNTDEDGELDNAALAATIFKTESESAAITPVAESFDWIAQNIELLQDMPLGATWYIPQPEGDFDPRAWQQQLFMGLRQYKAPEEILRNIAFAEAAPQYFRSKDNYTEAKLRLEGRTDMDPEWKRIQLEQLNEQWRVWQISYKNMHPVFAEELADPEGRVKREQILDELVLLLNDPPDSPIAPLVGTMTRSWRNYKEMADALRGVGSGLARAELEAITRQFDLWSREFVRLHPEMEAFYSRLIRPEIGAGELELIYGLEAEGAI